LTVIFVMVLSLMMILFGAELFTNAVEWFGRELGLGQGAVGSILAALGTALPETAVPVTAIVGGGSAHATDVGIGGILGAPFLLTTLGSLVIAVSLLLVRQRFHGSNLNINPFAYQRDMVFFLIAYALVLAVGCVKSAVIHHLTPFILVALYVAFIVQTLRDKSPVVQSETSLHPLYLQGRVDQPKMGLVVTQLCAALCLIVGGAHLLTGGVEKIAVWLNIPAFVVSALLIPLATELPETLNSVVWIRQGKHTLAIGNITGAMVFQSSLVPALGIWLTPWNLNTEALLTGGLTLAAAAFIYGMFKLQGTLRLPVLACASLLYWALPLQAIASRYDVHLVTWIGMAVIGVLLLLTFGMGTRFRHT
jgi:cation:H+ antiporter